MKFLVVDDHQLIRDGLRLALARLGPEIRILEAETLARAVDLAGAHPDLDLVLLDLNLPGCSGIDALNEMRRRHPMLPLVVLSGNTHRRLGNEVVARGALGFIPKTAGHEVLVRGVEAVLAGEVFLHEEEEAPPQAGGDEGRLTARQEEVLALMTEGLNNKAISRRLGLSEGTVKVHISAILRILNVGSRAEAIVLVRDRGGIDGVYPPFPG